MCKKLFCTILLTQLLIGTTLAQKPLNKFIDKHKNADHSICMTVPGWMIRSGFNFAERFSEGEDEKEYLKLGKYFKKLRFLVIDEDAPEIKSKEIKSLLSKFSDDGMDEYVTVKSEGNNILVWLKEDDEVIKNLALVIQSEDEELIVVNITTDMPLYALQNANLNFNKNKSNPNHH